jgi:hypothetical protein
MKDFCNRHTLILSYRVFRDPLYDSKARTSRTLGQN